MGFERYATAYKRILVDGLAMGYQELWVIRAMGYSTIHSDRPFETRLY